MTTTKIGIFVFHGIAFFTFFAGVIALFYAMGVPGQYSLYNASAPQITQVYSEAIFEMLKAVAFLLVALFIEVALYIGYPRENKDLESVKQDTAATKFMISKMGKMLQRSSVQR